MCNSEVTRDFKETCDSEMTCTFKITCDFIEMFTFQEEVGSWGWVLLLRLSTLLVVWSISGPLLTGNLMVKPDLTLKYLGFVRHLCGN